MESRRLQTLAFAEGFIEDFVEDYVKTVNDATVKVEARVKHAREVDNMWRVLTSGLADLRRENEELNATIQSIRNVI